MENEKCRHGKMQTLNESKKPESAVDAVQWGS